MSEKKLREAREMERQWLGRPAYNMHSYDNVRETAWRLGEEALADEPDVVKILRWLKSEEKYYTVNDDGSVTDFWGGLRYAQEQIAKQFHVRLTATGWEWTDDTS